MLQSKSKSDEKFSLAFQIADFIMRIESKKPIDDMRLDTAYENFIVKDINRNRLRLIEIRIHRDEKPPLDFMNKPPLFDSQSLWAYYKEKEKNIITLSSPNSVKPYRIAVFNGEFNSGDIYEMPESLLRKSRKPLYNPLEYPLSEVMIVSLLGKRLGALIHSCGINYDGRGFLFVGNSGAGKSTMASIWKNRADILNDDRIILRERNRKIFMFGTPWHGDCSNVSSAGIGLEKIFFLHHAKKNSMKRLTGTEAMTMLLTRTFAPFWLKQEMRWTLNFLNEVILRVPCFELGFIPNNKVIDFVSQRK